MRYAYVTFLMRGDGYLPGALVLAYALKLQTKHDCICLVTDDVSDGARYALLCQYDKVLPISELRVKSGVCSGRSDRNVLMTRFEALRLGTGGGLGAVYDKIMLLDADMLPLGDYDHLFSLPSPAGILMEHKAECYSGGSAISEKWGWHSVYEPSCPHGSPIPAEWTDRVCYDPSNMGVNAGIWVLRPSMDEYNTVQTALQSPEVTSLIKSFPWPEMQLATLLWSGRWTNIDIRYCSIGGYPRLEALYGTHFAGLKPWQIHSRSAEHYAKYPDFQMWRNFYAALYLSTPSLHKYPALKRLWEFCNAHKTSVL